MVLSVVSLNLCSFLAQEQFYPIRYQFLESLATTDLNDFLFFFFWRTPSPGGNSAGQLLWTESSFALGGMGMASLFCVQSKCFAYVFGSAGKNGQAKSVFC